MVLIFWRKLLRQKYRIAFDWHQLFEDWRDGVVARGSDYHLTTSKRLGALLVSRLGVAERKICVAYGGVDPAPFVEASKIPQGELRERLGLPQEAYVAGYIGGFTSVGLPKGLDTMIAALPHLPAEIKMAFVGGSEKELKDYEQMAAAHGVAERCMFVRKQPFAGVVEYELAMDALVIPYPDQPHFREWGFPMKVWEYMAAGRPILYSNLALIAEVRATLRQPLPTRGTRGQK